MREIKGKYGSSIIYTDIVEDTALDQLHALCDQPFTENCKIRIMPDCHAGTGCVIGFTADLGDKVIPNIVGVDIGCGMLTVELGKCDIDFERFDNILRKTVPCGTNVHEGRIVRFPELQQLECYRYLKDTKRIERSLGTLGGGNHFIELDRDDSGNVYLVIHTGSRNLGVQVANHYQHLAYELSLGKDELFQKQKRLIEDYKAMGKRKEIQQAIKELQKNFKPKMSDIPKELCYLTGEYREMYLSDIEICREFATLNRKTIAESLVNGYFGKELESFEHFETIHNYIDMEYNIIRKGAVSAKKGERLLIPINMKDGSLICTGKGNADWNFSAPHGAGRLYSRKTAKEMFSVEDFREAMQGIYTTTVNENTLDESPFAYKSMNDIVENITPTADITSVIKPIYNFKADK